jgi:hypothetical protein
MKHINGKIFRHEDLQAELEAQVRAIVSLRNAVQDNLQPKAEKLEQLATKLKQRQETLSLRIETTLQILLDCAQPELSEEEIRWIDELKGVSAKMKSLYGPSLSLVCLLPSTILVIYRSESNLCNVRYPSKLNNWFQSIRKR